MDFTEARSVVGRVVCRAQEAKTAAAPAGHAGKSSKGYLLTSQLFDLRLDSRGARRAPEPSTAMPAALEAHGVARPTLKLARTGLVDARRLDPCAQERF